ncbi:MAG: T9SS type A sorting domain-containing protein [Flavobacterium sp.]|nr:T9SS type A sorting domain-containing protein [Flavobacterium sp.]
MKKIILIFVIAVNLFQSYAQKSSAWQIISANNIQDSQKIRTTSYSEKQKFFQVDLLKIKQSLIGVNAKFSGLPGVLVEFPNSNGDLERFLVWENSNFEPLLQQQNPDIRAFIGKSNVDGATIYFSLSPKGIQTYVSRPTDGSEFIEPYTKDNSIYVLFDSKTRTTARLPFNCSTIDRQLNNVIVNDEQITSRANNQSYKTMRLALSCVGEYGANHGGTFAGALAAMNATMTRVNGVMEKDLSVHLNIINENSQIMYYNGATDPYSAAAAGSGGAWNAELQNNLSSVLGNGPYDIGHLFGQSGGGGNAGCIGCVCVDDNLVDLTDTEKGSAFTSPYDGISQGDTFDIDYVVHEMGHQLGGTHSFSFGGIGGSEVSPAGVEPGSGSTIMGYAGITSYDVQPHSDDYYCQRNITEIQQNMLLKTCPISTPITNSPPVVNAGPDFNIPSGTAYILKGLATDLDGNTLTYCWEENDVATSGEIGANCVVSPTKTRGPNYRSFTPSASSDRYMPSYDKVLAGTLTSASGWESVSTVARTSAVGRLKFTLCVRDNNVSATGGGQQTNLDNVVVTSQASYNSATNTGVGPFAVTSQNTLGIAWGAAGSTETVTWSVNNTTILPGSANVNIKLSIDGGITFPYLLATATANDGSEVITVPATPSSTNCRLWIEPTGNFYYAVNSTPFFIGYSIVNSCTTYNFNTPFAIPDGATSYTLKTLNVPTAGTISDVNINLNVTHPNLQNLSIVVLRPGAGATLLPLYNQQCPGNVNMNYTFDSQAPAFACANPTTGTYSLPTGTLNGFNGLNPNGDWKFGFRDTVAGNAGTVNSFSLEICSQVVTQLANDSFNFENFSLYPNPNNGNFTVKFDSGSNSKINITVNDIRGRKISEKNYNNTGLFSENIQLNNVQSGIYLVTIKDGEKQIVKKIVIE